MKRSLASGVVLALVFAAGAMVGMPVSSPMAAGQSTAAEADLSAMVEELHAKEAIRQQIYNYSRGLDRLDKDLAMQVWHPDGTADYGGQVTNGRELVEGLVQTLPNMTYSAHNMLDTIISVDGDTAVSETYAASSLVVPMAERAEQGVRLGSPGVSVSLIRGRYADRWSKRDGQWALDHRAYIEDFRTVEEVPGEPQLGRGTRDRSDPSYPIYPF